MTDLMLAVLRLWLGGVMLAHGVNHGRRLDRTARWFRSKGFRNARLVAIGSTYGEIAIGLGLIVGLLTSFAAAGLLVPMAVAFWTIHRFAGFFVFSRPDEGWEYVATLSVVAVALAVTGPGRYSLDHALGLADRFNGPTALAIAVGGLGLAALMLSLGWRRPPKSGE